MRSKIEPNPRLVIWFRFARIKVERSMPKERTSERQGRKEKRSGRDHRRESREQVREKRGEIRIDELRRTYGANFARGERVPIPPDDLPPGTPDWMRLNDGWADRVGRGRQKHATIAVTVPTGFLP